MHFASRQSHYRFLYRIVILASHKEIISIKTKEYKTDNSSNFVTKYQTFIQPYSSHSEMLWNMDSNTFHLVDGALNLHFLTGPCSAVGNVSGYRFLSDCRSRGH